MSANRFIQLVEATEDHIPPIADNMRSADVAEARAMGLSPAAALKVSLAGSVDAFTALVDGEPHAMMGLVPKSLVDGTGAPWLLGTEEVYRQPRAMLLWGPKVLALWGDSMPSMTGLVAVQNDRAIRFLRRLGFEIAKERQVVGGTEFVQFTMEGR